MVRRFTLEEANALIPRLDRFFVELRELRRKIGEVRSELAAIELTAKSNGISRAARIQPVRSALEELIAEHNARTDELDQIGCEVKDLDQGLVDFRALRDGSEVYLCWKQGESEIRYWHELETGFAGRQPL